MHLAKISIDEIREPADVARAVIPEEGIIELAESIKRVGLINPITVKEVANGYEVVAGHRRYLACKRIPLVMIPCMVTSSRDADPLALQLHENLCRQELTPIEEGAWYQHLMERLGGDTEIVANAVRRSREHVERRLAIASGDPDVLEALALGKIKLGVAEELNKIKTKKDRDYYLTYSIRWGATTALARQWREVANMPAGGYGSPQAGATQAAATPAPAEDPFICWVCGAKEPVHQLRPVHIHEYCRIRAEEQAGQREQGTGNREQG